MFAAAARARRRRWRVLAGISAGGGGQVWCACARSAHAPILLHYSGDAWTRKLFIRGYSCVGWGVVLGVSPWCLFVARTSGVS